MIVCGVDPGINGSIACYSTVHGLLERSKLPSVALNVGKDAAIKRKTDAAALFELLRSWSRRHDFASEHVVGVIERMQPFMKGDRKASPSSLVAMGQGAGIVEGVMVAFIRGKVLTPLPHQWKRTMGLIGTDDDADQRKARSVAMVQQRFGITVGHDTAEAILLALWGAGQVNAPTLADVQPCPFSEAA